MLKAKRKIGSYIRIGDNIKVEVLGVNGDTIELGIVAPKHISIERNSEMNKQKTPAIKLASDNPHTILQAKGNTL